MHQKHKWIIDCNIFDESQYQWKRSMINYFVMQKILSKYLIDLGQNLLDLFPTA